MQEQGYQRVGVEIKKTTKCFTAQFLQGGSNYRKFL